MAIEVRRKKKRTAYVVKVRDCQGKLFESKTFYRRIDAVAEENRLLVLKESGHTSLGKERALTVSEYWNLWATECRSKVSLGWQMSQNQMARDHIFPSIGHMRLTEIKPIHVEKILGSMEGEKYASTTIRHVYVLLHKMFGDAIEQYEILSSNPARKKHSPLVKVTTRNFLKPNDARKFMAFSKDTWLGPAIWIGICSGLRPGETQALRVKHLDFERGVICVHGTYNRKVGHLQNHTKQKTQEIAPMPPDLAEYLQKKTVGKSPEDFVVESAKGGMLSYHSFLKAIKRLCIECGVTVITPHELRHSCTELYVEAGASEADVGRVLNHKSPSATKRYMHRTDDRILKIAKAVTAKVSEPIPGPQPSGNRQGLRLVK